MIPIVTRPGQCYLCRKRPGTEYHRAYWACKRCLTEMWIKDVLAIFVIVGSFAVLLAVAKQRGYCPICPSVHLPAAHTHAAKR